MVGRGVVVNFGVGVMVGVKVGMRVTVGLTRNTSGSGSSSSRLQAVEMNSKAIAFKITIKRKRVLCRIPDIPTLDMPVIILCFLGLRKHVFASYT